MLAGEVLTLARFSILNIALQHKHWFCKSYSALNELPNKNDFYISLPYNMQIL